MSVRIFYIRITEGISIKSDITMYKTVFKPLIILYESVSVMYLLLYITED